ncbi:hypothetical protein [Leadbetterella byssophila]|uniref:hypothetical protein n=1 Tax=Leadbetterella byssophila TaxID=316068 RepID=UPI0039A08BA5
MSTKSEDIELNNEVDKLLNNIYRLYMTFYKRIWKLPEVVRYFEKKEGKSFWLENNKPIKREVLKEVRNLAKSMEGMINTGMNVAEGIGESVYDKIKKTATENARSSLSTRKLNRPLSLSERVWNISNSTTKEIEIIIQNAMKQGKSADQISREIRKYLNEPDKLFRPVKNKKTGKYELSEAARNYKPGRGVYRSSYKNAMRLVRTEMNAAMRYSVWKNIQNDPMIVGVRISLSNNRENGYPCKVCEALAGDYPKSFLWTGWHPQCRCIMTPITISNEELSKYIRAKDRGEAYTPKQITSLPQNFTNWWKDNGAKFYQPEASKPYWVLDNEESFGLAQK